MKCLVVVAAIWLRFSRSTNPSMLATHLIRPRIAILTVLLSIAAYSQVPGIAVSAGTQISADNPKSPHAESFLAINPKKSTNWIATSIVVESGHSHTSVYATLDGGRTWQRGKMRSGDDKMFKGLDPVVYFDPTGTALYGTLQGTPIGFLLSRSSDGGLNWEDPVTVPGGTYDREYLAFDSSEGKFKGRMYLGGTIDLAEANGKRHNAIAIVFSQDGGRTFSPGRVFASLEKDEEMFVMADLLVTSDGKLVIPFSTYKIDRSKAKDSPIEGSLWTLVSEDGGLTFLPATRGPSRSRGAGFRSVQSDAAPRAAIDASTGRYHDRIYLAWADFDGKKYVVKSSYSNDLGKRWSTPAVVNDNLNESEPANPTVAVNVDGVVTIIFNDRRDDPKNSCYRLYAAVSLDGGETFLPNLKASEKATCPQAPANWQIDAFSFLDLPLDLASEQRRPAISMSGVPTRWPNGGDTQGLVAGSDGVFHAAWINGETGVMQLWSKDLGVDRKSALQSAFANPRKDLSRDLVLDVSAPSVDFGEHALTLRVRLENPLPVAVQGPFTVVLEDVESFLKDLKVVNAVNSMPAKGAAWNFGNRKELEPKQKSDEKEFRWEFSGGPPAEPLYDLFRAHFRILGAAQK
jgi:hypothetical protein